VFSEPKRSEESVTTYTAFYGSSFVPAGSPLDADDFRPAWVKRSDQMSIRQLDTGKLEPILRSRWKDAATLLAGTIVLDSPSAADSDDDEGGQDNPFAPSLSDLRQKVIRAITLRRGQRKFRNALLRRFGEKCAISDCGLVDLLEAAHIAPYRGDADNHASNGLLLRADLHTLFDLNMMAIDPEGLRVRFHPAARAHGYGELEGKTLSGPAFSRLSRIALHDRWLVFQKSTREIQLTTAKLM